MCCINIRLNTLVVIVNQNKKLKTVYIFISDAVFFTCPFQLVSVFLVSFQKFDHLATAVLTAVQSSI